MSFYRCFLVHLLVHILLSSNVSEATEDQPLKPQLDFKTQDLGPKDYVFSVDGSRVRDLASFFESMKEKEVEVLDENNQNIIITQSEAASKLHSLSFGMTIEEKCSKYIKLITKPNIRTYSAVNLLMHEDRMFEDIEQNQANLESRLTNERNFNALGKLQSVIQTLESEKSNMKSSFSPEVQMDLLDCMSYYIYRHQRGVFGLTDYIQASRNGVVHLVGNVKEKDVVKEELIKLVDNVKLVEGKEEDLGVSSSRVWLEELSKLYQVLISNKLLELPHIVLEFVTNEKRLKRLNDLENNSKLIFQDNKQPQKLSFDHITNPKLTIKQDEIASLVLSNIDQTSNEQTESRPEPVLGDTPQTENDSSPGLVEKLVDTPTGNQAALNLDNLELESADSCDLLSALFDKYLLSINWNDISMSQLKNYAVLISKYKVDCFTNPGQQSSESIHWSFVSIRKKLVSRSLLELDRISDAQLTISNVLRSLNY